MKRTRLLSVALLALIAVSAFQVRQKKKAYKPVIDGPWWSITSQPDLGKFTGQKQQPVDFAIWKAKDGTWQLWSCIRGTKIGGKTRLFYRWEGKKLTDTAWEAKGIAMTADSILGETNGGLQAPYVFEENGKYYMFYGDWNNVCLAESNDGKQFTRVLNENGKVGLFSGPAYNTRDPMVLKIGNTYYCYYCSHNEKDNKSGDPQGAIYCRTSNDMKKWSEPVIVSTGGSAFKQTQWYGGDIECPFVMKYKDKYILFRNQRYGADYLNTQYCSENPLDFGNNNDNYLVGQLPVAAPEIVKDGNQYYIVSLKPGLDGMKVSRLKIK